MVSSASAAALLFLPFPTSSSSDDSDDARLLPPPPEAETPPPQQRWQSLERDCNVQMKELARAGDVQQVVDVFAELRRSTSSAGAAPNVLCYNTLLNALVEAGRLAEAFNVCDEMRAAGVAFNTSTINILIKMLTWQSREFERALELIFKHRELADVGSYSTLITGMCRAGELADAFGVLDLMLQEGCRPMVHTYTPIVQGYCREGRISEAKNLIAMMEDAGFPPNVVTYNVLIRALCDVGRFDEVKQLLMDSRTKGWKPSAVTYNTYMNGLCKKGRVEEALGQLDVMIGEGLDPTAFTLSIILNCLCHLSRASEAISLLKSTSLNGYAGDVAYNTVMSRLCDMGKWLCVLKLTSDMIKKGINPNTRTLNIVIHSLCIGGKYSVAKNLVYNRGFTANVVTYNTLIHWFYYCGKISEVHHLLADMLAVGIAPDEVTHTIIVDALYQEGKFNKDTVRFIESVDSRMSRDLLFVIINRLVRSRRIWEIISIFKGIRGKGFLLNYEIFNHTIDSFCKSGFCNYRDIFTLNIVVNTMLGLGKEANPSGMCPRRDK